MFNQTLICWLTVRSARCLYKKFGTQIKWLIFTNIKRRGEKLVRSAASAQLGTQRQSSLIQMSCAQKAKKLCKLIFQMCFEYWRNVNKALKRLWRKQGDEKEKNIFAFTTDDELKTEYLVDS